MGKKKVNRAIITASDSSFFFQCCNFVASAQEFMGSYDEIIVYDIGLREWQKKILTKLQKVRVYPVSHFVEHWQRCYTWKPWVMYEAASHANVLLYLDAGTELVKSPEQIFYQVERDGNFLVSQFDAVSSGHTIDQIIPEDYYCEFSIKHSVGSKEVIAGGLVGFTAGGNFFDSVITPWLEAAKKGYALGWSKTELHRNTGIHYMAKPPIRDCKIFRHDQTLFNIFVYKNFPKITIRSMKKYGSMKKDVDSEQVMWSPKIAGRLDRLPSVKFIHDNLGMIIIWRALVLLRSAKIHLKTSVRKLKRFMKR